MDPFRIVTFSRRTNADVNDRCSPMESGLAASQHATCSSGLTGSVGNIQMSSASSLRLRTAYPLQDEAMAMQVLVVDDSRLARAVLQGVLREALAGARVDAVVDLESAFYRAGRGRGPALVLLDLGLPGCTGLEALARFHGKYPHVPVVVVSATDDRDSIREALEAGAIGYISKSSPRDVIIAALRQVAAGDMRVPPEFERSAQPA